MGDMEASDEEILRASVDDSDAFNILLERHYTTFLSFAASRFPEEAEDIVQDSLLKMFKYRCSFKMKNGAKFKTWAYRIIINTAIDRLRKKKNMPIFERLDSTIENDLPDRLFETSNQEIQFFIKEALSMLPADEEKIIKAYYYHDLNCTEIAYGLNWTTSKVKLRLSVGRKKLSEILNSL